MHNVPIERINEPERGMSTVLAKMEKAADAIRQRAFGHFQTRGGVVGSDLDDWLRAERELIWAPSAEVTENDKEVTLRVQAPGLEPDDIQVTATPHSILIQAEVSHSHEQSNGNVCFCDFAAQMFRHVNLPQEIDVNKVTATLNKGILNIVAAKSQAPPKAAKAPTAARTNAAA